MSTLIVLIAALILTASSLEDNAVGDLYLHHSELFRSNARSLFESDEHFLRHQKKFEHAVTKSGSALASQSHPFIVRLHPECVPADCHGRMKDTFPGERYNIINSQHGVVAASNAEIQALNLKDAILIDQYIPLIPESKVDSSLLSAVEYFCKDKADEVIESEELTRFTLRLVLTPLSAAELNSFAHFARSLEAEGAAIKYDNTHTLDQQFQVNVLVDVADCRNVLKLSKKFSARREVLWIEEQPDIVKHNRWARGVCETGSYEQAPASYNNITGINDVIGVSDSGIDVQHCYFHDPNAPVPFDTIDQNHRRIVQYITTFGDSFDDDEGHGTHVAATAAGYPADAYGDYLDYVGIGSGAKIAFFDLGDDDSYISGRLNIPPNINTQLFSLLYSAGARVITNSWGSADTGGAYTEQARQADQFMFQNPDSLVIYSAGNSGSTSDNSEGSINSPATFKNGLSIGAGMNDFNSWLEYSLGQANAQDFGVNSMAGFSSRGPTSDNRLKPDIVAPGWWTTSARGIRAQTGLRCDLAALRGTSMSAPTAAGIAVIVRQYFRDGYYPSGVANPSDSFIPSGALLKAVLVHSGQPMSRVVESSATGLEAAGLALDPQEYPSNLQGYGRIQLDTVLNFVASTQDPLNLFVVGAATSGTANYAELSTLFSRQEYTFRTDAFNAPSSIRVTLAYTDSPGTSGSNVMINRLSVEITDLSTSVTTSPYSVTGNVQVIDLETPTAGTSFRVSVFVQGLLSTTTQPYALVVSGVGATRYLPDVSQTDDDTEYFDTGITTGARNYIIGFGLLTLVLGYAVHHFRVLTKKKGTILLDPKNFENLDGDFEFDVPDTGMGGRKSILATIRDIRRQSLLKKQGKD